MLDEGYITDSSTSYPNMHRVRRESETSWTSVTESSGSSDTSSDSGLSDPPSPTLTTYSNSNLNHSLTNINSSYSLNNSLTNSNGGLMSPDNWPPSQVFPYNNQARVRANPNSSYLMSTNQAAPRVVAEFNSNFKSSEEETTEQKDAQNSLATPRTLLRPWLMEQVKNNSIQGLQWIDEACTLLRIPWKHGSRNGWSSDDCRLFESWAKQSGKLMGSARNARRWKANFRCALRSLTDVKEVREMSRKTGRDAFRVYRFLPPKQRRRSAATEGRMAKDVSPVKEFHQHCSVSASNGMPPRNWMSESNREPKLNYGNDQTDAILMSPSLAKARPRRQKIHQNIQYNPEIKSEYDTNFKSRILESSEVWTPDKYRHVIKEEGPRESISNYIPIAVNEQYLEGTILEPSQLELSFTRTELKPSSYMKLTESSFVIQESSIINQPRHGQPFVGSSAQNCEDNASYGEHIDASEIDEALLYLECIDLDHLFQGDHLFQF